MLPIAERAPQFVRFTKDDRQGAVRPVWTRRGTAIIEAFGGQVPYDDIVLVAAFPCEAIQSGRPFAIYKERGDTGQKSGRGSTRRRSGVALNELP